MKIPAEFLQEYGLYRKYPVDKIDGSVDDLTCDSIQLYCGNAKCGDIRTWVEDTSNRTAVGHVEEAKRVNIGKALAGVQSSPPVHSHVVALEYVCAGCGRQRTLFLIWSWTEFGGKTLGQKLDAAAAGTPVEDLCYLVKIGQHPRIGTTIPAALRKQLGEHEDMFTKGWQCENQGFGIGAYGYYRRVVDDIIVDLLAAIREFLIVEEKQHAFDEALKTVEDSKNAADKIDVVKHHLSEADQPLLKRLHSALSLGLHSWTEEECLERANDIRDVLTGVCDLIAARKKNRQILRRKSTEIQAAITKKGGKKPEPPTAVQAPAKP